MQTGSKKGFNIWHEKIQMRKCIFEICSSIVRTSSKRLFYNCLGMKVLGQPEMITSGSGGPKTHVRIHWHM